MFLTHHASPTINVYPTAWDSMDPRRLFRQVEDAIQDAAAVFAPTWEACATGLRQESICNRLETTTRRAREAMYHIYEIQNRYRYSGHADQPKFMVWTARWLDVLSDIANTSSRLIAKTRSIAAGDWPEPCHRTADDLIAFTSLIDQLRLPGNPFRCR